MYKGLKSELARIICDYKFHMTEISLTNKVSRHSFTLSNQTSAPMQPVFTITKETVHHYNDVEDYDTGQMHSVHAYSEDRYNISVGQQVVYKSTPDDVRDYADLFTLCQERNAFHQKPQNVRILQYLANQR